MHGKDGVFTESFIGAPFAWTKHYPFEVQKSLRQQTKPYLFSYFFSLPNDSATIGQKRKKQAISNPQMFTNMFSHHKSRKQSSFLSQTFSGKMH